MFLLFLGSAFPEMVELQSLFLTRFHFVTLLSVLRVAFQGIQTESSRVLLRTANMGAAPCLGRKNAK